MGRPVLRRLFTPILFVAALLAQAAPAQQVDPRVLQQLQGQLGAGQQSSGAQLDAARSNGNDAPDPGVSPATTVTPEELELRRQRSRNQLDRLYVPNAVERDYRERLLDPTLRLFGYDLFRSTQAGSGPLTGAVGDSYILGVGDELVVSFQGATSDSRTTRVDREGRLVVGQLPPVRAAGRSLGAVRSELASATRRTMLGTDVYVSLGSVRSISIFVGGEVERPGSYQMTSLGDVATAISRAGGIRRSGSLRRIRVVRSGGGTTIVDLYGLLGIGVPQSVRLQDGDRVIVPVIGDTAAITGSVARPGIYELRGPVSVSAFVDYAGGALRARGYKVAVSRIGADGQETYNRTSTGTVMAGDAVQIVGGSAGGTAGRVALRGFVINPGARPLGAARTVHDLLGDPADLQAGTYMPMAVLKRRDALTSSTVYEPVNLITALRDEPPVPLRGDDQLYVLSQADIRFMNRPVVRRIVLGQPNGLPKCESLQRLAALVRDSKSSRFSAIVRGSMIVDREGKPDLAGESAVVPPRVGQARADTSQAGRQSGFDKRDIVLLEPGQLDPELASGMQRQDPDERTADQIDADDERLPEVYRCAKIFEEAPDLLPVLIENAVAVGGAVRQPGAYPIAGPVPAESLIAVSGGLTSGSGAIALDVIRSDDATARIERVAGQTQIASIEMRPGDDLRVNSSRGSFEAGGVVLSGEFVRPGIYSIRKGETLSQLVERAGGVTPYAYPYGAIFTRRSVKQAQEEGFKRTARELRSGLLAASARKTGDNGDSLQAAAALINELAAIQAPGRVVVEADPRVLAVRTDLDTVLEPGDAVVMPKTPNFVLALGDVLNPGALQFTAGKSASMYLREAGGFQRSADDDRAFLVLPDGTAGPIKSSVWRKGGSVVPPGSTIIVPKNLDPLRSLDLVRDVATIFGQFVTAIASVAILATK